LTLKEHVNKVTEARDVRQLGTKYLLAQPKESALVEKQLNNVRMQSDNIAKEIETSKLRYRRLEAVWKAEDLDCKVVTQVLGTGWDTESDTLSMEPRAATGGTLKKATYKIVGVKIVEKIAESCVTSWKVKDTRHCGGVGPPPKRKKSSAAGQSRGLTRVGRMLGIETS
jgi:hypothetical protein